MAARPLLALEGLFDQLLEAGVGLGAPQLATVDDGTQNKRNWRRDLVATLAKRQGEDGSWVNSNRQWFENDKNLCTSFALLALSHCKNPVD